MFQIRKYVAHGDVIPPWYGIAWHDFYRDWAVCYPMPVNMVAGVLYVVYLWLRHGRKGVCNDPLAAYSQGYRDGKNLRLEKGL